MTKEGDQTGTRDQKAPDGGLTVINHDTNTAEALRQKILALLGEHTIKDFGGLDVLNRINDEYLAFVSIEDLDSKTALNVLRMAAGTVSMRHTRKAASGLSPDVESMIAGQLGAGHNVSVGEPARPPYDQHVPTEMLDVEGLVRQTTEQYLAGVGDLRGEMTESILTLTERLTEMIRRNSIEYQGLIDRLPSLISHYYSIFVDAHERELRLEQETRLRKEQEERERNPNRKILRNMADEYLSYSIPMPYAQAIGSTLLSFQNRGVTEVQIQADDTQLFVQADENHNSQRCYVVGHERTYREKGVPIFPFSTMDQLVISGQFERRQLDGSTVYEITTPEYNSQRVVNPQRDRRNRITERITVGNEGNQAVVDTSYDVHEGGVLRHEIQAQIPRGVLLQGHEGQYMSPVIGTVVRTIIQNQVINLRAQERTAYLGSPIDIRHVHDNELGASTPRTTINFDGFRLELQDNRIVCTGPVAYVITEGFTIPTDSDTSNTDITRIIETPADSQIEGTATVTYRLDYGEQDSFRTVKQAEIDRIQLKGSNIQSLADVLNDTGTTSSREQRTQSSWNTIQGLLDCDPNGLTVETETVMDHNISDESSTEQVRMHLQDNTDRIQAAVTYTTGSGGYRLESSVTTRVRLLDYISDGMRVGMEEAQNTVFVRALDELSKQKDCPISNNDFETATISIGRQINYAEEELELDTLSIIIESNFGTITVDMREDDIVFVCPEKEYIAIAGSSTNEEGLNMLSGVIKDNQDLLNMAKTWPSATIKNMLKKLKEKK